MTKKEIIREFTKFLKNNKAYTQYRINITEDIKNSRKINDFHLAFKYFIDLHGFEHNTTYNFINYAFTWASTKQGDPFWRLLDSKWRRVLIEKGYNK
jgi:hypothetical protein